MSNDLDRKILEELRKDSCQSIKTLAKSLGATENTVRRRIDLMESSGDLLFTVLPNLKKLGFPIRAYILLHVNHLHLNDISNQLCKMPCLRFVSHCIGFADLYARGDFTSLESMSDFIHDELGTISGISKIDTKLVCKELKREYRYITASPKEFQGVNIGIDKIDYDIISSLQKNARATLKELSDKIGVSDATIHRHIRNLVNSGTIEFRAIPSGPAIEFVAESFIGIQTELPQTTKVANILTQYPQVRYVGYTTGPIQILSGVHAPSTENLSEFVTKELIRIKGITGIETLTYMKVLKQTFTWI